MPNEKDSRSALRDLLSAEPDSAARAADALYASMDSDRASLEPGDGRRVVESVEAGNRTATSVLLLGYVTGAEALLHRLIREHGDEPVKLHSWSHPVPLRVAATAALSRLGDTTARQALLEAISSYDTDTRIFLLDILPAIDAPRVWHEVSKFMDDTGETHEGVPSGAEPRRRVADHAVDAFLNRFGLQVSFEKKPGGRYAPQEIEETKHAFRNFAPQ